MSDAFCSNVLRLELLVDVEVSERGGGGTSVEIGGGFWRPSVLCVGCWCSGAALLPLAGIKWVGCWGTGGAFSSVGLFLRVNRADRERERRRGDFAVEPLPEDASLDGGVGDAFSLGVPGRDDGVAVAVAVVEAEAVAATSAAVRTAGMGGAFVAVVGVSGAGMV